LIINILYILIYAETSNTVFQIDDIKTFKEKAFAYAANAFDVFCYLDNNGYTEGFIEPNFDCLLAWGVEKELVLDLEEGAFQQLKIFQNDNANQWLFGFLTYDLKNDVERLTSKNPDNLGFPCLHFFKPKWVLKISKNTVEIVENTEGPLHATNQDFDTINFLFKTINSYKKVEENTQSVDFKINTRFEKEEYIETVEQIKRHIQAGDIFEMNFCQEFFIENTEVNPYTLFQKLNTIAQAPFTAFYKLKDKFALCASPERYLKKEGQNLTSQPIKGTSKRGNTEGVDEALKNTLFNDPKNRSENVMIVDLVRNDLGKICKAGTIKVSELFGIYSFPTVHQMISTVIGTVRPEFDNADALRATFPMGSMTGAPKVRAMQLIENYERTRRGLYSGAIGYMTPKGDFDFNVLIRSLLYNQNNRYLSFQVGGAIVADSDAEKEYEECLVKIQGILRTLSEVN
jgi:para-aminobenzoate synthetase component I